MMLAPFLSLQIIVYALFVTHPFHSEDLKKKQKYIFASQIAFCMRFSPEITAKTQNHARGVT